jgi:hypothetical protein
MDIKATRKKYEAELLKLPNVTGVGIGERAGETVIKVYVTRKIPEADLLAHEIVPKTLGAYRCDVEELGFLSIEH